MAPAIAPTNMLPEQNKQIADTVGRERRRLWAFIRRRVLDDGEAEDILQEVLYELVIAYRQVQPLEEVGAWLFRVARNRITDLFRRKRPVSATQLHVESLEAEGSADGAESPVLLEEFLLPAAESLKDTLARVQPYWTSRIGPELRSGRNVMVVAHGNSLRAMVKMLDNVSESEITELNIPTGVPLLYELDQDLQPVSHRYLGDPAAIAAAAEAVRRQTEKK